MLFIEFVVNYFKWHYFLAPKDIVHITGNLIWFFWNYFSVRQLLRTLFVPWKRLGERVTNRWSFFNVFSAFIITLLMRITGAFIRLVTILFGIFLCVLTILFGIVFIFVWFVVPLLVIVVLGLGLELLMNKF